MRRPLLIACLASLPVLGLLLFLGTWQVQRMQWKNDLLARIAASEAAPAAPLREPPEMLAKVRVAGRFDHGREALLGLEVRGRVLGSHVVTPLLREGAAPILVNRGWVPLERRGPVARPEGEVTVEGWVHPGDRPGWFSATDDPAGRRFYTFDPPAIGAALGLPAVAPFGLVALGEPGFLPEPARTLPRPTNNHLGYAITWYGLALSLLGVLAAFALRRRTDPAAPPAGKEPA
ncbi:SURF1 family protein [Planktothrix agardhii 1811]|uniref:SURF1 family protein n=1 Tax=Planktothrix agardhii TaxID=1160 RepID=UPI001F1F62A4|nr:SURF1 family protein [Planktothrix agardhii]MCF3580043.1 SURF1 family protein [Planktothrix agardhii 1811]